MSRAVRRRLDVELVRRKLARSRETAQDHIRAGGVTVNGIVADKPARQVTDSDSIVVAESVATNWVSRGSGKLLGALDALPGIAVAGRICLDAGASTGGFTAVLLERGAARVFAVDVGYGQLAWRVASDPRVEVLDRTNIRYLTSDRLSEVPDLVTADLSFISLRTVLAPLRALAKPDADFLLMVKPQFEVGKEKLPSGAVVTDPAQRASAILSVASSAWDLGLGCGGVVASPLPGPSGNVEYFLWLHQDQGPIGEDELWRAIEAGPR